MPTTESVPGKGSRILRRTLNRRGWLGLLAGLGSVSAMGIPGAAAAAGHRRFIDAAFAQRARAIAAGDQAYGAVVVRGDDIIGLGPSRVVVGVDPTAHAEVEAIRDACRTLGHRDLAGCVLYSTFRPCPMCQTAAYWAGIDRYFFGQSVRDGGRPGYGGC